ncbi:hypothetical protein PSD17_24710 [Pseudonocardia sp. D17]|nr:hypothetical protein PSD17_24710 [Pseudonocardia sp. D17]
MRRSASTLVRSPYPPEVRATRLLPGIVLLVGALLAGCSSPTPGAPAPAAPVASTPAGPPELALDGVNPCSLISATQLQTFGLSAPSAGSSPAGFSLCQWQRGRILFQITAVIGPNPEDYRLSGENPLAVQVGGYPALQTRQAGAGPGESCILSIGVKRQQVMQVLIDDLFATVYEDNDAICSEAARFAMSALESLQP